MFAYGEENMAPYHFRAYEFIAPVNFKMTSVTNCNSLTAVIFIISRG